MVKARFKGISGPGRSIVHCGKCGQRLWGFQLDEESGRAKLLPVYAMGWRYDAESETWRPTERAKNQWRERSDRILKRREEPEDRRAVKDAHALSGRSSVAKSFRGANWQWLTSRAFADALDFPTNMVCIQCGATNRVDLDD